MIVGCDVQRRRLGAALGDDRGRLLGTVFRPLPGGDDFREWLREVSDALAEVEAVAHFTKFKQSSLC